MWSLENAKYGVVVDGERMKFEVKSTQVVDGTFSHLMESEIPKTNEINYWSISAEAISSKAQPPGL